MAGGQAVAILGAVVGVRLLTEALDPNAYGELMLGLTLATLVNQTLLGGPLGAGISRFFALASEKSALPGYAHAALVLAGMGALAAVLLGAAIVGALWASGQGAWVPLAAAALAYALLAGFVAVASAVQTAARRRAVVALHRSAETWLRFALAAALAWGLGGSSTAAMVGYALALALVLGSQLIFLRRLTPGFDRHAAARWRRDIGAYSWPFMTWGVVAWLQLASDRWALQLLDSTHALGLFGVVYQLGFYPMTLAAGVVVQFIVPFVYQFAGDGTEAPRMARAEALSGHIAAGTLLLTAVAVAVAMVFHGAIFRLFVAEQFRSVSYLFPWMVAAGGLFAAGQALSLTLLARLDTRALIAPKTVVALGAVAMNFAGVYWAGVAGVVSANLVAYLVYLGWMALLARRGDVRPAPVGTAGAVAR